MKPMLTHPTNLRPLLALVAVLCGHLCGCQSSTPSRRAAPVNHPVFFSLNNPADANALIADCDALLRDIPGVVAYYCGPPLDTGRDSVDLEFDVGLYIGFDSVESYDAYITHPNHEQLVAAWMDRIESIRVHDVLDESPE